MKRRQMKMSEQNRKKIEEVSKIDLDMAGVEQKPSYFDYRLGWQVDPNGGVSQIPDFLPGCPRRGFWRD